MIFFIVKNPPKFYAVISLPPPSVADCQEVFYAFDDFVLLPLMIVISIKYK